MRSLAKFKKLVVSRPIQPVGKDIGFLPGSMEDKMMPWLAPIQDNLQYLMGNDKLTLETYMKSGIIEMEALIQKNSHRSGSEMRITSCMLETDFIT